MLLRLTTWKRRLNKITNLSLPILKNLNAMHALAHQSNCNFWRSFEGASKNLCFPDANFPEDKAEDSHRRIKQTRSFILVSFTR
jgi:hypothetical protein